MREAGEEVTGLKFDTLALIILLFGVSLFHIRGLLPGQAFLPADLANNSLPWRSGPPQPQQSLQNWLISDPLYEFYPFLANDVNTIRQSSDWPVWNPRILLGHPVFADPINQPFYPFFVALGLILGAARGLAVGSWLHAVLAAIFTYGFLRTIQCRRPAAVLGAFTYALSGHMVTWFEATHRISTLAWLPGVLWAFELAVQRRSLRYVTLAGLMLGLATLGGQFQFVLTFGLFLAFYSLGRMIELTRQRGEPYLWPLAVLAMTAGLGALLSAIQTVPFAEFLALSHRALAQYQVHPFPAQQLITLIVPNFYGNPASVGTFWGQLNFIEGTIYAGLPALVLAGMLPFSTRRFFPLYLFTIAIVAVYFIVGGPGVGFLRSLPVLQYASPYRSAFLIPLLIALLAALSLSESRTSGWVAVFLAFILTAVVGIAIYLNWGQAQQHWQEIQQPVLVAVAFLVVTTALIALRHRLPGRSRYVEWTLVGLVYVDLFLFGSQFNPVGPVRDLMPATPAVEYLQAHSGEYQVAAYQLDDQVLIGPNVLSIYGIAEAGGYSSLVSERVQQLIRAGDPKANAPGVGKWLKLNGNIVFFSHPSRRLLDLLQVAYVVSPDPLADSGVRSEFVVDECAGDTGEIAGNRAVDGSFVVRDTAINRLDLRFRVLAPPQTTGMLLVRMWQGTNRNRLILKADLDVAELQDRQNRTLYFAPEREAPGQTYIWEVAAEDAASRTGVGLCTDAEGRPAISVYGADWAEAYAGEVYIHERLAPMPRTYVVYAAEHISDDDAAIGRLLDESFDLRNMALTAEDLDLPTEPALPATRAEIVEYGDTRVVVSATAHQRGLLVLGDQFYPGWRAYLDGEPVTIQRVNYLMRGVELPPGEHVVEFRFEPRSLRIGAGLSLLGILLLTILIVLDQHPRVAGWLRH